MYDVKQLGIQAPPKPELSMEAEATRYLEALKQLSPALANMQEFELQQYLIEHEVPQYRRMLTHLATFDFEHPEDYVAMDSGVAMERPE